MPLMPCTETPDATSALMKDPYRCISKRCRKYGVESGTSVLRSRLGFRARPRILARPSCDQPRLETYANPGPRLAHDVFLRTEFHPPESLLGQHPIAMTFIHSIAIPGRTSELGTSFSWKRAAIFWVSVPSGDEQLRVSISTNWQDQVMDKNDRHISATFDRRIAHVGATAQAPEHLSAVGAVLLRSNRVWREHHSPSVGNPDGPVAFTANHRQVIGCVPIVHP
jgi:hypothetical protein